MGNQDGPISVQATRPRMLRKRKSHPGSYQAVRWSPPYESCEKVQSWYNHRKVFAEYETQRYEYYFWMSASIVCKCTYSSGLRQALRYIIRNTTLTQRARAAAQLQLFQMHCYTRSTQINNRCLQGGKGRGVLGDFRMARVRAPSMRRSSLLKVRFAWASADVALLVPIQDECACR